jgi:AmpD protein
MAFEVDVSRGLLSPCCFSASPHCDARPEGAAIDLLVIHNISLPPGVFGGYYIDDLFLGRLPVAEHPYFESIARLKVSAHVLIRRDGEVVQFVPFHQRAWHAGPSSFSGRAACNDFSIGIELEGADDVDFEESQYQQLAAITQCLMVAYPGIKAANIVGHSDIAPGRKTDPGPHFDWMKYYGLMNFPSSIRHI